MDLSSLEDPALHEHGFLASTLENTCIDHPRVEVTLYQHDNSRHSPSCRASTRNVIQSNYSATAHDRGKLTVRPEPGSEGRCRSRSRSSRGLENRREQNPQCSILSDESPRSGHFGCLSPCGASSGQNQSLNPARNDHLIWLEDEQVWISMHLPTSTVIPHAKADSTYRLNPTPQNPILPQHYDPRVNDSKDSDELPPSYESHGFVQDQLVQESQWMNVAQRISRLSLS